MSLSVRIYTALIVFTFSYLVYITVLGVIGIDKITDLIGEENTLGIVFILSLITSYYVLRIIDRPKRLKQGVRDKDLKPEKPENKDVVYANDTKLEEWLKLNVIGQERAIREIVKEIKKKAKKEEIEGKPLPILGTFLFVGLTGVGKTETAKAISSWFQAKYGHQFLQFDMGNFSDYHTASTLVGSPRGYLGSEEGGALTRPLMRNPRAVILFDELEKAHYTLYKPLMRLIDEGLIQEVSTGEYARLREGIIIFTSNLYQGIIRYLDREVTDEIEKEIIIRDVLTGKIETALRYVPESIVNHDLLRVCGNTKGFPPEFIGRIDKIVPFRELELMDLVMLTQKRAYQLGVKMDFDKAGKLATKYQGIAQKYGVRVFLKKIEDEILGQ